MKKRNFVTANKNVYKALNSLNFSHNVWLDKKHYSSIKRILCSINKGGTKISLNVVGNIITLEKKKDLNFNLYLRNKK